MVLIRTVLFLSLLLAGCQSSTGNKPTTRLLLDWLPNPNHIPLYVGMQQGFFDKRGINLEIMKLQDPSDSLPYLTSGQADLSLYYMPDTFRCASRGANAVSSLPGRGKRRTPEFPAGTRKTPNSRVPCRDKENIKFGRPYGDEENAKFDRPYGDERNVKFDRPYGDEENAKLQYPCRDLGKPLKYP